MSFKDGSSQCAKRLVDVKKMQGNENNRHYMSSDIRYSFGAHESRGAAEKQGLRLHF